MPCNCKNKSKYQVKLESGKVVFMSSNKSTADAVALRYPGSTVTYDE